MRELRLMRPPAHTELISQFCPSSLPVCIKNELGIQDSQSVLYFMSPKYFSGLTPRLGFALEWYKIPIVENAK